MIVATRVSLSESSISIPFVLNFLFTHNLVLTLFCVVWINLLIVFISTMELFLPLCAIDTHFVYSSILACAVPSSPKM